MMHATDFRSEVTVDLAFGKRIEVVVQRQPIYMAKDEYELLTGRQSGPWQRPPDAVIVKDISAVLLYDGPGFRVPLSREEAVALLGTTSQGRTIAAALANLK